ncbi:citrate lyase subunit alpha, partial [Synergistes jonesii]|uniref:citrate lyase subunit alpha n=1 Tax=Synergistes jonesii TaxID=2754 RepID=UPI00242C7303
AFDVTDNSLITAIVTERGICINSRRPELLEAASKAGLHVSDISSLKKEVEKLTGVPETIEFDYERPLAAVEYRDGTLIDAVYAAK